MAANHRTTMFRRDDDDLAVTQLRPRLTPLRIVRPTDFVVAPAPAPLPAPAPAPAPAEPWKAYAQIGLAPKQGVATKAAAKLVVSGYRVLGISILSLIVFVLVGYIGSSAFYFLSHSWIVPTIISPSDDKVVTARNELAAAQNLRGKLQGDLHDTEREIAVEQQFQLEFTKAVEDDLAGRKEALARAQALAGSAAATRSHVRATTDAYAKAFAARTQTEYASGLIDRGQMMNGTYQVAQMSSSSLALAEKQAELDGQATDLARQTRALDALLAEHAGTPMSYDVLKIKRDFEASKLALAKALETRDTLTASLARQDETIHSLEQSTYLRALDDHATVALVPYANLGNAAPGSPLYACKVAMVWCHQVGSVALVLPGEVAIRHPHDDSVVRGQMVELKLTDLAAAEGEVLFAGGKPLGL